MKLYAIHLFLILIGSLLLCSLLGGSTCEGMTTNTKTTSSQIDSGTYVGPAGDTVHIYKNANDIAVVTNGNTATPDTSENYSGYNQTSNNSAVNSNSGGIPGSQIAPGDENLYILKSQIVSPVCPVGPSRGTCPVAEPPQPCPACARCPEPSFDCKKVPNYRSGNDTYLPTPVLNDFSSFGM